MSKRVMLSLPAVGEDFTSFDGAEFFFEPGRSILLIRLSWSRGLTDQVVLDVAVKLASRIHVLSEEVDYGGHWHRVRCIHSRWLCQSIATCVLRALGRLLTPTERKTTYAIMDKLAHKKLVDFFRHSESCTVLWRDKEYAIECSPKTVHLISGDFLYGFYADSAWLQD